MKHLRLTALVAALLVALAGCIPGLGTFEPINVRSVSAETAVATFVPAAPVQDVIVSFAGGGIDLVEPQDPRFQCQEYRGGWDCYVTGQDDAAAPRLVHEAGLPIRFTIHATRPAGVVASAFWRHPD